MPVRSLRVSFRRLLPWGFLLRLQRQEVPSVRFPLVPTWAQCPVPHALSLGSGASL